MLFLNPPRKALTSVASGLIGELDAPTKVKDSFDKLNYWLEKNQRTVFFFIDDIDRATGEQIKEILSEIKTYVSVRRIIVVLGYDERYILDSLKDVLPVGIDPKNYLEKIVSIGKRLPLPRNYEITEYGESLLGALIKLSEERRRNIAHVAASFFLIRGNIKCCC